MITKDTVALPWSEGSDPLQHPLNSELTGLVRNHLREILASPAFSGSKRSQDFLQLIVEHALAGRLDSLRERMIGAEMFGRPIDYDTANDAVVRVKASEVRRRLAQYYRELSGSPIIRIELSTGSYEPKFHWPPAEDVLPQPEPATAASSDPVPDEEPEEPSIGFEPTLEAAGLPASVQRSRSRAIVAAAMVLLIILGIGSLGFRRWMGGDKDNPTIHSLAILPIQNLTGDPHQEYLTDGITEQLIADLGQIAALRVISRTSSMTYKNTHKTLPEIARELDVDAVVEGSLEREGNRVRVEAQLVDARTDTQLWTETYDRELTSVLTIVGDVAKAIALTVRVETTERTRLRLSHLRSPDPKAQDLYLQGLSVLNAGDPTKSIAYFEDAIRRDHQYAAPHSSLATAWGWLGDSAHVSYADAFPRQMAEALKAIELDESLSEAHVEVANAAISMNWDWVLAEKELRRALELNPNSASAHRSYSSLLYRIGRREEALREAETQLKLDPVSSRSHHAGAYTAYYVGQYDQAFNEIQAYDKLETNRKGENFLLGLVYTEKGMYRESIAAFSEVGDGPPVLGHMGYAMAKSGDKDSAMAAISKLKLHLEKDGMGAYEIALIYAGLGEDSNAFLWLEKAFEAHDKGMTFLKADPCMDSLRSDPRFQVLLERVGFPPS